MDDLTKNGFTEDWNNFQKLMNIVKMAREALPPPKLLNQEELPWLVIGDWCLYRLWKRSCNFGAKRM